MSVSVMRPVGLILIPAHPTDNHYKTISEK